MALGNILREKREARGLSTTEVAEHTNMMVQIVEELEDEDFHRIAAPIYGRGFLKLYAELLEIDPQPLIDEFMDIYTGKTVPAVRQKEFASPELPKMPAARVVNEAAESAADRPEPALRRAVPDAASELPERRTVGEGRSPATPAAPERARIVPHAAVRSLDLSPAAVSVAAHEAATDEEVESLFGSDSGGEADTDVSRALDGNAPQLQVAGASDAIPPSAGDDLFEEDEPNLFNTTPLQERLAAAKRLMEEKENPDSDDKSRRKNASLHLSPNQRLPVFQVGGRMDKIYEAERRKVSQEKSGLSSAGLSGAITGFFQRIALSIPFNLRRSQKTLVVYGGLGLMLLLFVVCGVMALYKLTGTDSSKDEKSVRPEKVIPGKSAESAVSAYKTDGEGRPPPPPDLYFD